MFIVGIVRARELLGEWRTLVFVQRGLMLNNHYCSLSNDVSTNGANAKVNSFLPKTKKNE